MSVIKLAFFEVRLRLPQTVGWKGRKPSQGILLSELNDSMARRLPMANVCVRVSSLSDLTLSGSSSSLQDRWVRGN